MTDPPEPPPPPPSPPPPSPHYFSPEPASAPRARPLSVQLEGRQVELISDAGVFSADRIDPGTQVLLRQAPDPPDGDLLDLGCGWGPIALTMALRRPGATVWAVDVNRRALELTGQNADRLALTTIRPATPEQVPADLGFAAVWSNPPIRIGKPALHAMLELWLPRLLPGAEAHLVVQRNLGADSLQEWLRRALGERFTVERAASSKGYRVLRVLRTG